MMKIVSLLVENSQSTKTMHGQQLFVCFFCPLHLAYKVVKLSLSARQLGLGPVSVPTKQPEPSRSEFVVVVVCLFITFSPSAGIAFEGRGTAHS